MTTTQQAKDLLTQAIDATDAAIEADDDYWTRLACGQDTEEAEASGSLAGHLDALRAARKALDYDFSELLGIIAGMRELAEERAEVTT